MNPASSDAVFDRASALRRVDGDLPFLKELGGLFLQQCPEQLELIVQAVAQRDADLLMRAAHSLKGSVGNLSGHSVYELALHLEAKGRAGDLNGVEQDLADLQREMENLRIALEQLIAEPS